MQMMVTGATGQLGKSLKKLFPEFSYFSSQELDITNAKQVKEKLQACAEGSFIINCAAFTAVDKAEEEEEKAFLINQVAVRNLSKECIKNNLNLIHISTDYVFDGNSSTPYAENSTIAPLGTYGRSKRAGEEEILKSMENFVIIRTSWLYSEFGNNFVKTMLKLKSKANLNVVFDQIGTPTCAGDLAKAIVLVCQDFEKVKGEIFHFSNEGVASWFDFAQEIMSAVDSSCKLHPIESSEYPTAAKRPHYSVLSKNKIKEKLNIEIPYWKESLRLCLKNLS